MISFMWLLGGALFAPTIVFGETDAKCYTNCTCCINRHCGPGRFFPDTCLDGCIDGHRGARCYELCQYTNCKSCGGTTASTVCEACYDGHLLGQKKDCALKCPSNCKSCTSSTVCTECKEGFYDKDSSTTCKYFQCPQNCECSENNCNSCKMGFYHTSENCTSTCPLHCDTCVSKDKCDRCTNGFYNGYKYDNNRGVQLNNCTYNCRDTCAKCQSYNNCSECVNGKYGLMCQQNCSVGCKDNTCLIESGNCDCLMYFSGDKCTECVDRKYCNQTCPKGCDGQRDDPACVSNLESTDAEKTVIPAVLGSLFAITVIINLVQGFLLIKQRINVSRNDARQPVDVPYENQLVFSDVDTSRTGQYETNTTSRNMTTTYEVTNRDEDEQHDYQQISLTPFP